MHGQGTKKYANQIKRNLSHLKIKLSALIFLLFLSPSLSLAVGTIGVKPLRIDLDLAANKKEKFEIEVYSTSPKEDTPIHLSLFDAMQKEDGSFEFVNVGLNPYSCSQWVKLEKEDYTVPAGENAMIKGEVLVPMGKSGSRVAIIMIEPDYEKKKTGVSVRLRYAVVLKINIQGRPAIENAKIERVGLKKLSDGTPVIEALLFNQSETDFEVKGKVILQDNSNRIISTLELTTESLERKKKKKEQEASETDKDMSKKEEEEEEELQRVYPGVRVSFFGRFNKPMIPGEYTAIYSLKYGQRSLTAKGKITLTEDDIVALGQKTGKVTSFEIKPANLEIKGQPGGMRTAFFSITNQSDKPMKTVASVQDLEYDHEGETIMKKQGSTPYSASSWIQLEKSEYEIGPRLSQSVSMKVTIPKSAQSGGRYTQVVVEKLKDEAGQGEMNSLEVGIILPGKVEPTVEIKNIKRLEADPEAKDKDKDKETTELAVSIKNNCDIHLVPKGRVIIKDMYNNEVEEIELKLKARAILPQTEGIMSGKVTKKLIPGEYLALAEIDCGGKDRVSSKINFLVK